MLAILMFAVASLPGGARAAVAAKSDRPRFYYDLGPDRLDVSRYPKAQQENYAVFARVCAQCHTLARPINAPIVSRGSWARFIKRMHGRTEMTSGASITPAESKKVLDFLVYDSRVRKVEGRKDFVAETARLKTLFARARRDESRAEAAREKKEVRETPMERLTQAPPVPKP